MPSADPYIGREILGQFRIIERVGSGGMGAVYKAEQPSMDRLVAVKILHPKLASRKDLVSRFRREARAMSHLTHPNTVRVFLYGQLDDGSLYIVMEFLSGRNLAQVVRAEGPMSFERALPVMIQACGALEEAHRQGIVHRDLKPENIFLCTQGGISDYAKVLDFGLAKVTEREMRPGSLVLTQEGMVFGTPEFMSPEQAQGKTLDPRSDIYSLGVILYELLTGKLPFSARVPMEFISLHVNAQPIPLRERAPTRSFPAGLQDAMDKALAKNPDHRYQTAAEFAAALRGILPGGGRGTMSAIPPAGSGGGGGSGGLLASAADPAATEPTVSAAMVRIETGRGPAPAVPAAAPVAPLPLGPRPVQQTTAGWAPVHLAPSPEAAAAPPAAAAPSPGPGEPEAVTAQTGGATPATPAAVTPAGATASGATPVTTTPSRSPSTTTATQDRATTGRSRTPSHGPTEFGESRLSVLEAAPSIRVRRSSAGPIVALGLLGIGVVATVVAFVLSQNGDAGQDPFAGNGPLPTPLPPVPPVHVPLLGPDAGAVADASAQDGGAVVQVRSTPDAGPRQPGQQRDPPRTARCPALADQQLRSFARACAPKLISMDSFSINYTIDESGRARVTFGGSAPSAFRSCMIDQAVNLRAAGVEHACRGRFGFP